jgi:hypothetical protein
MSAAPERGECQRLDRLLSAYVDDELDAIHCLEVEEHVDCCGDCAELVATLRATRASLQRVSKVSAPMSLRERIGQTLEMDEVAEEAPSSRPAEPAAERASSPPTGPTLVKLRYVVPLAAAATLALVLGASQLGRQNGAGSYAAGSPSAAAASASFEGLIDELVRQHIQPPPVETDDPEQLSKFEPHIGVRLQRPRFHEARWVGARMQQNAALMQYILRDRHRVSIYVFDPQRVPLRASRLHPRHVGSRDVFVGRVRGYSVAASECDGIGYALASDLTDEESVRMLVAAAP